MSLERMKNKCAWSNFHKVPDSENVRNIKSFGLKERLRFFSSVQVCIGNFSKCVAVEKAVSNRQEMSSSWVETVTAKHQKINAKF